MTPIGHRAHTRHSQAQRSRSEEHTSELQSLMHSSYAVFCLKQKTLTRTYGALTQIDIDGENALTMLMQHSNVVTELSVTKHAPHYNVDNALDQIGNTKV